MSYGEFVHQHFLTIVMVIYIVGIILFLFDEYNTRGYLTVSKILMGFTVGWSVGVILLFILPVEYLKKRFYFVRSFLNKIVISKK